MDATYTWSHSWGNNEGFVRSNNEQDDAGLTDGAAGNLPNDRRHQVKMFAALAVTDALILGSNFSWKLDLSAKYILALEETDITFRADVYNVFNNDRVTEINEIAERGKGYGKNDITLGEANPDYGLATNYQSPRYVRLSASFKF